MRRSGTPSMAAIISIVLGLTNACREVAITSPEPTPPVHQDSTPPIITTFALPATLTSLNVIGINLSATDASGVAGFYLSDVAASPSVNASAWTSAPPVNYVFASAGDKTLYAWAKDASGNISSAASASVSISIPPTLPEQFASLASCFLSTNPASLTSTCLNVLGPDLPLPAVYDSTEATKLKSPLGATYFRISVPSGVTGSPGRMYPVYAKTSAWNADGSKLLLLSSGGWYHLFDGNTYQWIRRLEHPANYFFDGIDLEPRWSQTDPDVFYYRAGMSLYRYSVSANASTLIRTFTDTELGTSGCTSIRTGEEGNPSDDNRYWSFWCQTGSPTYAQQAIFVYDLTTDTVIASKGYGPGGLCGANACPTSANWVGMSHSGNHAIVQWNAAASWPRTQVLGGKGTEAFDRSLSFVSLPSEYYSHGDLALTADKTDVYVGPADLDQSNGYSAVRVVRLADGVVLKSCMFPQYPLYNHVSGRTSPSIKGWVLYSTYNQTGSGMGSKTLNEEAFALNIGTCEVRRIAHTQSNWTGADYYSEPHAVMNFDFTKILWGSNWRVQGDAVQAYVAEFGATTTSPGGSFHP